MSPKTSRKATTSTMEGLEKMQPRPSKRDFFELQQEMGLHLEISEITCPKSGWQSTTSKFRELPLAALK